LRRVEEELFRGGRVLVDASFHSEARRRAYVASAVRLGVRVRLLVCEADREVI
ncbi:MAG: AAA family ATPase, partial [Gammaproteobacteria bacterium]|nr:ATP-binding protein [Gemmatimonadota bacterium]NIT88441.1 ATP-binding protein [Gemmatimonadota bacterium]NIU73418.1 AAA family ATPase [Gammaproteobacteria bacterium]NIX40686.1 AAA family ATPase [Gemmatimonadota bacterium]